MNEPENQSPNPSVPPRQYRWPWVFWGAVVVFIAITVATVGFAAHRIATQRDPNTPLPGTSPMK